MGDNAATNQATMANLSRRVSALKANGGTAIFSATRHAYQETAARRRSDPQRFYSIIIMTDGINNKGIGVDEFAA